MDGGTPGCIGGPPNSFAAVSVLNDDADDPSAGVLRTCSQSALAKSRGDGLQKFRGLCIPGRSSSRLFLVRPDVSRGGAAKPAGSALLQRDACRALNLPHHVSKGLYEIALLLNWPF